MNFVPVHELHPMYRRKVGAFVRDAVALYVTDRKPTLPELRPLVRRFYGLPNNEAAGTLHIVLDDGNIDNDDVTFCIDCAGIIGDGPGVILGKLLLRASKTQRNLLYLHCWRTDPCP